MESIEERAEARVRSAIDWMETHGKRICLLTTLDHFGPEFSPHERLPELERAAARFGLHLHYAGSEAKTIMGDEPMYYVLLSEEATLTEDEIRDMLPGFHPIHHWHHGEFRAAA